MKELQDIVAAYQRHQNLGQKTALATVVHVEGSSYRRPGARMLVAETGELTGAISGGCLEGDALRKARLAMSQGKPALVTYDTMDEEDATLGVGLGCNGIIHILIEPILPGSENHPLMFLQMVTSKREAAVLVTFFSLEDRQAEQPGSTILYLGKEWFFSQPVPEEVWLRVQQDAPQALRQRTSLLTSYSLAGASLSAFVEVLQPGPSLVICGAGNDVMPLVNMAALLGWPTTVFDGRANYAIAERFPKATKVLVAKPEHVLEQVPLEEQTVFLLLTHNYNYDLAMLRQLLPLPVPYIGVLGPKKKLNRLLQELQEEGMSLPEEQLQRVYGPTGLDLGAETAEEIALSILAEIKTVFSHGTGGSLREKKQPIHSSTQPAEA
ncbi:XdhC family protein [Rufibacter glacialis]|uniref:XdhC family protein n=1 Tax=Rufibacter glacialis TaxID=1259555 RepID=A0A5M8QGP9_9BACT|nr:XdhC/CoxI family protein [Rufibacter glacialis]KAA6434321.1 XdhC family protein [Rufibacter glacialis]GGK68565.1 putative xanthine dehydrogenase subunit A [Rufibacter glacialis]